MDDSETKLLRLIYTRVGMVMKDASVIALGLGSPDGKFEKEARVRLLSAASTIAALLAAVDGLFE